MLITFIVLILTTTILYWYYRWNYFNQFLKNVPGPKPLPIIGSSWIFRKKESIITIVERINKKYGTVAKVMMGFYMKIFISGHEMLASIMSLENSEDRGECLSFANRLHEDGLIVSSGNKWKQRRKMLTPSMHINQLKLFLNVFDHHSNILVNKLNEAIDKKSIDIYDIVHGCSLDIIYETIMGVGINTQTDLRLQLLKSIGTAASIATEREYSLLKQFDFFYRFTEYYKTHLKASRFIRNTASNIIAARRAIMKNQKNTQVDDLFIKTRSRFLDILIEGEIDGKPLTDEDIEEEVRNFLIAGQGTVTIGMAFTLYCISNEPNVQRKILEEQKNIFQEDPNRVATYEELMNMKYLDSVIKEALRLYPPVPIIYRSIKKDVKCPNEDILKSGLLVNILIWNIHRDPKIYPNPDKFDPDRFADKSIITKNPYAYIPFSGGPRDCIGKKFAMLEMKLLISKVVRKFQILPVPDYIPDLSIGITLKPLNGVLIKLIKRDW